MAKPAERMKIAVLIYEGFTALDVVGPYEVMSRWPGAEISWVSTTKDPVVADEGLTLVPTATTATMTDPDVLVIGGATDPLTALKNEALLDWVRQVAPGATWLVSVCTGASIYAQAGLIDGRRSTTHWGFRDNLAAMGVDVVPDRVVFDGNYVSGAGVSAGIDMALALTAHVHGDDLAKALQLGIEYDPQPPFDTGGPEKADARTLRIAVRMLLGDHPTQAFAIAGHQIRARAARLRRRLRKA